MSSEPRRGLFRGQKPNAKTDRCTHTERRVKAKHKRQWNSDHGGHGSVPQTPSFLHADAITDEKCERYCDQIFIQ